jgi:hypothetical protein
LYLYLFDISEVEILISLLRKTIVDVLYIGGSEHIQDEGIELIADQLPMSPIKALS